LRGITTLVVPLVCGALFVVTGCGAGAVEVPVPRPDAATTRHCAALRNLLPDRLHDRSSRTTRPASGLTTAWGAPAIALRCGVPRPPSMRPTAELVTINGISWFPQPPDRPVTFTALGRRAYVEVTIPVAYAPAGDVLVELTDAIKTALPARPDGEL
jgi:hypothetical protein